MKKYLFMCCLLLSSNAHSQLVVSDPGSYVHQFLSYLQQIEDYALKLKQWDELVNSNKFLNTLVGGEGLWEDTFKSLDNIRLYIAEARDVISIVQARDAYALIAYLPINDDWKKNMHNVLNQTHGLLPDGVFDQLASHVGAKNPILSDFLIRSRSQGRAGLDHRLNSYYYASARKDTTDKRIESLVKQKAKIESFGDRSQGEATNMINSQLLLISQQNEEILKALTHQIVNSQTEYFENIKKEDDANQLLINYENQRQALDINDFLSIE